MTNKQKIISDFIGGHSGFSGAGAIPILYDIRHPPTQPRNTGPKLYRWEDFHPEEVEARKTAKDNQYKTLSQIEFDKNRRRIGECKLKKGASQKHWSRRLPLLALVFLLACLLFGFLVHVTQ